jgi:two-component system, NarL family, nitrate/nitrite response regulator NarL
MVRVAIVSHVRMYRDGLATAVAQDDRFDVTVTAATAAEAVAGIRRERPDLALVDTTTVDVRAAVLELRGAAPGLPVVAIAVPESDDRVVECAEAGVAAIVTRDSELATLLNTLESVQRGELLCTPRVAASLLRHVGTLAADRPPPDRTAALTTRERQVVGLIDDGLSNKEIARELCIELPTVKNHVHHILGKLQVSRRADAAAWARARQ